MTKANKIPCRIPSIAVLAIAAYLLPTLAWGHEMRNRIAVLGDGQKNAAMGKLIKDILIFQVGGWKGLLTEPDHDPDFPAAGGKDAYLGRGDDSLAAQMKLIHDLSDHAAVAVLLMNDGDSDASGYGVCWNDKYSVAAGKCLNGKWTRPLSLYATAKEAAKRAGVPIAPDFSIMNYEFKPPGSKGNAILPKIKALLDQVRPTFDEANIQTTDGRYVVILDGLPEWAGLNDAQKKELFAWMESQSDIFWIDNLIGEVAGARGTSASNIFRSTWGDEAGKDYLRSIWGANYLWWYTSLSKATKSFSEYVDPSNNVSQATREKWMNIAPHSSSMYPVIISQWNEYAEYLTFEPSERIGKNNYDYLKWMISRQPGDEGRTLGEVGVGGSYLQSCSGCGIVGNELTCTCLNRKGISLKTSADVNACPSKTFGNQNGMLVCDGQTSAESERKTDGGNTALPSGSYAQSCSLCQVAGSSLSCSCANKIGIAVETQIDIGACTTRRFGNDDGKLTCY